MLGMIRTYDEHLSYMLVMYRNRGLKVGSKCLFYLYKRCHISSNIDYQHVYLKSMGIFPLREFYWYLDKYPQ